MTYVSEVLFECPDCGFQRMVPKMAVSQMITCQKCKNSVTIPPATISEGAMGLPENLATPPPFGVTPLPVALSPQEQAALASAVPVGQDLSSIPSAKPTTTRFSSPRSVPAPTPAPATPPAAKPPTKTPGTGTIAQTLEFTCAACNSRMRLPNQYLGKSILCPKCKAPQKVVVRPRSNEPMKTTRSYRKDAGGEVEIGESSASRTVGPRRVFNTPLPSSMEFFDEAAVVPIPGSSASRPAVATTAPNSPPAAPTPAPAGAPAPEAPAPAAASTYGMTMAIPASRPAGAVGSVSGAKAGIAGAGSAIRPPMAPGEAKPIPPARLLMPWMVAVAILGFACIGLVAWLAVTVPTLIETKVRLAAAESERRTSTEAELAAKHQVSDLTKQLATTELRLAEALEKLAKTQEELRIRSAVDGAAPAVDAGKPAETGPAQP